MPPLTNRDYEALSEAVQEGNQTEVSQILGTPGTEEFEQNVQTSLEKSYNNVASGLLVSGFYTDKDGVSVTDQKEIDTERKVFETVLKVAEREEASLDNTRIGDLIDTFAKQLEHHYDLGHDPKSIKDHPLRTMITDFTESSIARPKSGLIDFDIDEPVKSTLIDFNIDEPESVITRYEEDEVEKPQNKRQDSAVFVEGDRPENKILNGGILIDADNIKPSNEPTPKLLDPDEFDEELGKEARNLGAPARAAIDGTDAVPAKLRETQEKSKSSERPETVFPKGRNGRIGETRF